MADRELIKQIIYGCNHRQLSREVIYRRPYTYAKILYVPRGGTTIYGHGFSKVCWPDRWDRGRGYEIAVAKAARDIVSQLTPRELDRELEYEDISIPF